MSKKIYKETYFQHDRYARQDPKIKSMLVHFRKESELKAQAAVCIFWWIIEDMHTDDYPINKLEVFADDYRCDVDFLKSILEDFELFKQENGFYVSDRVIKNLKEQEEKSEKARKAVEQRWKNKGKKIKEAPDDKPETKDDNKYKIDTEFVNEVIQIYNTEFKKTQIVSNENRERIDKITKDNKLTLEIWQAVFSNAKRGWDIKGEHKKPNLQNILDKWDLFASDDYYLAPDNEKAKRDEIERKKAEKEAEKKLAEESEKARQEREAEKNKVIDKTSAIAFINKYVLLKPPLLERHAVFKEFSEKYNINVSDVMSERTKNGGINNAT